MHPVLRILRCALSSLTSCFKFNTIVQSQALVAAEALQFSCELRAQGQRIRAKAWESGEGILIRAKWQAVVLPADRLSSSFPHSIRLGA
jgi:hypothetical protein